MRTTATIVLICLCLCFLSPSDTGNNCICGNPADKRNNEYMVNINGELLCGACATKYDFFCKSCGIASSDEYTDSYCDTCAETKCASCDLCGGGLIGKINLVKLPNNYYLCVDCAELMISANTPLLEYIDDNSVLIH